MAKAVLGFERTTQLRSRLAVDTVLRRWLGFESNRLLPSEATFSRAFAERDKATPRSRIPAQLGQTAQEALADLPQLCNKGKKRHAQGHLNTWVGLQNCIWTWPAAGFPSQPC